jgi:DNA-binding response OmpR family regulator
MNEIIIGVIAGVGATFVNFIATRIYNALTGFSKNFLWKNKFKNLKDYRPPYDFEELKKRTRIVVIDDEESFPVKLFQNEGYSIDKWDSVTDYGKLESGFYDIIVLDIKGVALHISEDDGLGVLESIKENNPAQIIIAYSQHIFDLSKSRFWELADEKIAKPSDFLKIKNKIDSLIRNKYKPERYIDSLHAVLIKNRIANKEIRKLDSSLSKLIKTKNKPDWDLLLDFSSQNSDLTKQIVAISNTILKFFQ